MSKSSAKTGIRVARELVQSIYDKDLKPGDRYLSEADALKEHGVSRATYREAMRFLEFQGALGVKVGAGGGTVVNTASSAGLVAWPLNSVYGATKAGVVQLTKCAALDYAKQNIRVNAVCPGITWTGMVPGSTESPIPPADAPVPPGTPMERWGLPGEIAAAALFLASDEASFVTGTAVPVDGGYVAG